MARRQLKFQRNHFQEADHQTVETNKQKTQVCSNEKVKVDVRQQVWMEGGDSILQDFDSVKIRLFILKSKKPLFLESENYDFS